MSERRGFRLGGVVLAAVVALFLTYTPIPMPTLGSLNAALAEIALVLLIRGWGTFAALVVILSLGRQGIDVLLLRAILTAFILGLAFFGFTFGAVFLAPFPIPITPLVPLPIAIIAGGLIYAVTLGPVVFAAATVANLLWYRSFTSLRPQLGIFNRGSRSV